MNAITLAIRGLPIPANHWQISPIGLSPGQRKRLFMQQKTIPAESRSSGIWGGSQPAAAPAKFHSVIGVAALSSPMVRIKTRDDWNRGETPRTFGRFRGET